MTCTRLKTVIWESLLIDHKEWNQPLRTCHANGSTFLLRKMHWDKRINTIEHGLIGICCIKEMMYLSSKSSSSHIRQYFSSSSFIHPFFSVS
ncbi:unnamed protein product, partial [Musa hybrid cultivar]